MLLVSGHLLAVSLTMSRRQPRGATELLACSPVQEYHDRRAAGISSWGQDPQIRINDRRLRNAYDHSQVQHALEWNRMLQEENARPRHLAAVFLLKSLAKDGAVSSAVSRL